MSATCCHGLPQNWHSGHMNGMAMFADIEATHEPNNMNSHLPRPSWATSAFEGLACQQQRPTRSPWYGTIIWGHKAAIWWQVNNTEPFPFWSDHWFTVIGINASAGYGFAFFACTASAVPLSRSLQKARSTGMRSSSTWHQKRGTTSQ